MGLGRSKLDAASMTEMLEPFEPSPEKLETVS